MSILTYQQDQASDPPEGDLPLTLRLNESFEEFVKLNPDIIVEQNSNGDIVIMSPMGGESSECNAELTFQLRAWSKQFGGVTFDSSIVFCLPDGSKRSPDASWISSERWLALPLVDRKKYPPIAPDFVIELRSESDRLKDLQEKMQYYMNNGVRLGWLIDPFTYRVQVYQPGGIPVEIMESPKMVSCQQLLPEFKLDLTPIWKKCV
jgi:Uma2 family endonuclease